MDLLEENPPRHLNGFANPGSTGQVWCAVDAAVYPHLAFADLHAVHNGRSHLTLSTETNRGVWPFRHHPI